MPDQILGLPSSQKFADRNDRFFSHRRKVFEIYPNGGTPLTGLLSLMPEETVNDTVHIWYERRYEQPITKTRGTNAITLSAPSDGDANDGTIMSTGPKDVTVDFYVKVATTKFFKPGSIIRLETSGRTFQVISVTPGVVEDNQLGYLHVRPLRAFTIANTNNEFPSGEYLRLIGTAHGEGQSGRGLKATGFRRPINIMNTTQIFRDHFDFPGSVLQLGLKYDDTGPYRMRAKDAIVDHMTSIERALLFGQRSTVNRASFDTDQEDLTVRTMSGVEEFIRLWDAGSAGLQIDGSTYNPYNVHPPRTSDSDDEKRFIENASGTVTVRKWNEWAERVGRYHSSKTNEKLVLCGSGAMLAFNDLFRRETSFQVRYGEKAYGMSINTLHTPFGDFHFHTHPLFNDDPTLRHRAMILDVWCLRYRPLRNRDTRLLKNRQNNGDDFRRDEYLTESTLEMKQPENCMIIENVLQYAAS